MGNHDGFADVIKELNKIVDVQQKLSEEALIAGANHFVEQLKPRIPRTTFNKQHLIDNLGIEKKEDKVTVVFYVDAFYWYMAEHGHLTAGPKHRLEQRRKNGVKTRVARKGNKKVKGQFFVRNTIDAESERIGQIMLGKINKKI